MILFASAIISSVVFMMLSFTVNYESGLRGVFYVADLTVNLWCIYLQFSFAKDHYQRCCGFCGKLCRKDRTQQMIHIESTVTTPCTRMQMNIEEVLSMSDTERG